LHELVGKLSQQLKEAPVEQPKEAIESKEMRKQAANENSEPAAARVWKEAKLPSPVAAPVTQLPTIMVLPPPSEAGHNNNYETGSVGSRSIDSREGFSLEQKNFPPLRSGSFNEQQLQFHLNDSFQMATTPVIPELLSFPKEWHQSFGEEIDKLIDSLSCYSTQLHYRTSVLVLLKKQVRAVLGTISYDTGLFPIRCCLPEDPIKLTVILNQTQYAFWHSTLSERLKLLVDNSAEIHRLAEQQEPYDEGKILVNHNVRNIHYIANTGANAGSSGANFKILCAIDSLDVEITANNRHELCFLEFLEEFSLLIDRNHLFKKSLLLIRAWWYYETPNYGSGSIEIKQYLSEYAISVMVVSIFNRYHQQIHHPMIAFLLFLTEFSQFDGINSAITIQGVVPFENESSNQPKLIFPSVNHLISYEMMEKYWKLFNLNDPLNIEPPSGVPKPQLDVRARQEMMKTSMYRALLRFERFGFDVIHPFTNGNMTKEKLSSRRVSLITTAFTTALMNLTSLLQNSLLNPSQVNEILPQGFFVVLHEKVATSPWRPDALNNMVALPGTDLNW
jgi:hypothetical protein